MLHDVALIVLSFMKSESPNITERLRLKRGLGCRNFHWYLTTVYPQLYIPQDRPALSGEVENTRTHTHRPTWLSLPTVGTTDWQFHSFLFEAVQCWYWQLCRLPPRAGPAGRGHEHRSVHWDGQPGNNDKRCESWRMITHSGTDDLSCHRSTVI